MKKNFAMILIVVLFLAAITGCSKDYVKFITENKIKNGISINNIDIGGLEEKDARAKLEAYAKSIDIEPLNAKLDADWNIARTERPGKKVNIDQTLKLAMDAKENSKVDLVVEKALPRITAQSLKQNIVKLASYSTELLDRSWSRTNNIKIASSKINNKIIAPGQEFSLNNAIGRRTSSKGYEEAPIIVNTEKGPKKKYGVGGGICQLASTLYNAVINSGMEVTERHMHSKTVKYVPKGKDATVSINVDFKFKNTNEYPIKIKTFLSKDSLTVSIYENRNKT